MGRFDLIIFDCDGTLMDSEYPNCKALCDILAEHGFPQYDIEYAYEHFVGKTTTTCLMAVQAETGYLFPPDTGKRYLARVNELYGTDLKAVPEALEVVSALQPQMKTCVASNGERGNVLRSLELGGFRKSLFTPETIFTKNQVNQGKPAPDLFLYAAEKMGADPLRTLVIEDSESGVVAGKAAGMVVAGFTGTAHDPQKQGERLSRAGADHIIDRLIHIQTLLDD